MTKSEAIELILAQAAGMPLVFTTGYACRIAKNIADRPENFYMTGSMGLAALIGIGVAECSGKLAAVIDGDGSALMNLGALLECGRRRKSRIVHLILDDQAYASTGHQKTHSAHLNYSALAIEMGYSYAVKVTTAEELAAAVEELFIPVGIAESALVHCILSSDACAAPPRIDISLAENAARFRARLNGSEEAARPSN